MTTPTAQSVIQDALELLQAYSPGESVTAADFARGMSTLNQMLDVWSNYTLACYEVLEQSFTLVPGQQSYTIGLGPPPGQLAMTRPLRILDGPGTAYVQDFNGNNYGVSVVPRDQWNLYGNRSILIQSDFPDTLFYDPQYPLGVINVMPVPTIGYTMFFDSYLQLAEVTALNSSIILPPGYERAIVTNLAVRLKAYFNKAQIDPLVALEAASTLGDIKRTNMRSNVAVMEPEMVSHAQISYNPYTDRSGNSTG